MAGVKAKSHEMDMCNGPIVSKMLIFAIPLMPSNILQLLFNAADVIVVGKFAGEDALAAVGSTGSLVNLFVNFFMGMSVGANVLVARFFGAKQEHKVKDTVHTSILVSLICGIFLLVFGILFSPIVLRWMQSPPEVLLTAAVQNMKRLAKACFFPFSFWAKLKALISLLEIRAFVDGLCRSRFGSGWRSFYSCNLRRLKLLSSAGVSTRWISAPKPSCR